MVRSERLEAGHAGVASLTNRLATWTEGEPPVLSTSIASLRALFSADISLGYGVTPRAQGLACEFAFGDGIPSAAFMVSFDDWLRDKREDWTGYNPLRPEPWQRNRPMGLEEARGRRGNRQPAVLEVYRRWGLREPDQLRVLVCEGPSLLAWVGVFRQGGFGSRERRWFRAIVPRLRRRLALERTLARHVRTEAVLVAAMEAIASPAFVVAQGPTVLHANAAGRALVNADARSVYDALSCAIAQRPSASAVTRLRLRGTGETWLVAMHSERSVEAVARCSAAAQRWGLTPKQRDVLCQVVSGLSNRAIAATLGITEGTVELHVSAILDKAQVDTRSMLMARVWMG